MSITITDEMVDMAMAAGLGPRSPFVFDPVYVGFDLRAALAAAAPLIEAAVRERCAAIADQYAKTLFDATPRDQWDGRIEYRAHAAEDVAEAIRADGGAE
jgi:hypothetical protein